MTADLIAIGSTRPPRLRLLSPIIALGRTEAVRVLTSPAILLLVAYLVVMVGFETITATDGSRGFRNRAAMAEVMATFCIFLLGPITFVSIHLAATSARRSGSDRLLVATPVDQRRRDLGLCLGVLAGPALLALVFAAAAAVVAGAGRLVPGIDWIWTIGPWRWTDVLQVPAIVLGAGILGVVVARWVVFPGSLVLGFVALIVGTGWLQASPGALAVRPWLAPYVAIRWWSNEEVWVLFGSPGWHTAYLFALSGLGVCVVALRHRERRGRWLVAGAVAVALVVTTGLLQLPPSAVGR
jgi:hypothetical protein